jgi:hypothetical protein
MPALQARSRQPPSRRNGRRRGRYALTRPCPHQRLPRTSPEPRRTLPVDNIVIYGECPARLRRDSLGAAVRETGPPLIRTEKIARIGANLMEAEAEALKSRLEARLAGMCGGEWCVDVYRSSRRWLVRSYRLREHPGMSIRGRGSELISADQRSAGTIREVKRWIADDAPGVNTANGA